MKQRFFLLAVSSLLMQSAFAMLCPGNFNQMNLGDSKDQVIKSCGKPDSQKTEKSEAGIPQEWSYYIKSAPTDPTSLKMTVAFTGGVVSNITTQGTSLASTQLCSGNTVSVGDSMESVKAACGDPPYINKGLGKPTETTTFIYNTSPQTILIFDDKGMLKERK